MPDASLQSPAPDGSPRARPLVVGVLGGIASGKSEVARVLAGDDGALVDADRIAHSVLASPEVSALVRARFGATAIGSDGRPDRAALARVVFQDDGARAELEGWIHPRVRDRMQSQIEQSAGRPIVVLDVPLLLENDAQHGLASTADVLVYVDAPLEERDERARRDRGWSAGEVARREAAQLPQDRKRARAQHVIANRADLAALRASARDLRAELLR